MIFLLNCFITEQRPSHFNRYPRIDIFKYTLNSYKNIPFTHMYFFVLLDREYVNQENELTSYIYSTFSNIEKSNIYITYNRITQQLEWIPIINNLINKHGLEELVWFLNNDDHVFIDFDMDILNEGLELLKLEQSEHKSLYFSHWPEIIRLSGKYNEPTLVKNYVKFDLSLLDSIQIFNMKLLHYIFIQHKWRNNHTRIDSILNEITATPAMDNPLQQKIYVPLREIGRKFNGYSHANMDTSAYSPLELPHNTFKYSEYELRKKITASHYTAWTRGNHFKIPEEWISINLSLHPHNLYEYTL